MSKRDRTATPHALRRPLLLVAAIVCWSDTSLGQTVIKFIKPGVPTLGFALANAGDLDQDGYDDILASGWGTQAISGHSGKVLKTLTGDFDFGFAIAGNGDANGDGRPDFAVSGPDGTGHVKIFSGANFAVLKTVIGDSPGDFFGWALDWMGDVNGDGRSDLLVGSPLDDGAVGSEGSAAVISSTTGATLMKSLGANSQDNAGSCVASPGDLNGDGVPDFAYGSRFGGYCRFASGATGSVMLEVKHGNDTFGQSMRGVGDVNLDGTPDVLVGEVVAVGQVFADGYGGVHVISGVDGRQLRFHLGEKAHDYFGFSLTGLGDIDEDGHPDYAAGCYPLAYAPFGSNPQYVIAYSGATGTALFKHEGYGGYYGRTLAGGGDVNGDGVPDLLIGVPNPTYLGLGTAGIDVVSGQPLALSARNYKLSMAAGGVQTAELVAGVEHAGKLYLMLGTASGTVPGTSVGTVLLPLNQDALFAYSVTNPNHPPYAQSFGVLDAAGNAEISLTLTAGLAGVPTGLVLDHAALVFGANAIELVTNALTLVLDP